ncbi:MFS transporter [Phytoactinopolyspora endophytica]|uniref:MFS transporter n=1 Tax=Phytoactinopolyspora endophytica TaxID=1642495 RepID=UPI00101BB264|nr:MFS transporter [Phytoactinopolyspora endophytica]
MTASDPGATTVRYPAALTVLLFASTLGVMAGAIVSPVLEVIRNDLDVDGTAAGLIITTHGLTIAVASPFIGKLLDRHGVRIPMGVGLVLFGLGGGAGTFTTSYPALIASRLVLGLGAAVIFSGTTVALLALYRGAQRDRVMGWRTSTTMLGGVAWPLLGGALGGISWHAAFAVYLIGIPLGIATLLFLPADSRPVSDTRPPDQVGAIRFLRRYPTLLAWYGLMMLAGIMLYTLAVFLPQRLAQIGVEDPFKVSLFAVTSSIASSIVGLIYARVRGRYSYTALLRTSAACWVAGFLVLGTASTPALLFPAIAVFGVGAGLLMTVITILIGETPPPEQRGQATSLSGTAMFVGQFASPLIFGPLMGATSITTGYLVAASVCAVVLIALLLTKVAAPAARDDGTPPADRAEQPVTVPAGRWASSDVTAARSCSAFVQATAAAAARPAIRPENRQPPRKVPSKDR